MRVGFISDLHVDRNFESPPKIYLTHLVQTIEINSLDLLIIGGDISNHYTKTIKFVEKLQKRAEIPVYFIPGNHDFWEANDAEKDTKKIYNIYKNHPQSLIEKPLQLNDEYTLVAHPAWYNYAVYDKDKFSLDQVKSGKFRWAYWQDKLRMNWKKEDPEVSAYFADLIKKDLEKVKTEKIILQTHIVTIPEFTVPMPNRIFDFFNAFIATDDLKDIHKKYPITHQIMGHIHFRAQITKNQTQFITNSLGYRREWRSEYLYKEMQDSLFVLDLNE